MPDEVTVVKIGGAAGVDPAAACAAAAARRRDGRRVVLVHGGSAEADRLAARMNVPIRRLAAPGGMTSRRTDAAMLEVVTLALAGGAKPRIISALARAGVPAIGLTGLDAGLVRARRKRAVRTVVDGRTVLVRDDLSGRISAVDPAPLRLLLDAGMVPVVSPPALAADGPVLDGPVLDGPVLGVDALNVNADRLAAAVAVALRAAELVLLTAAPGVLADPDDERSVLADFQAPPAGTRDPRLTGGMAVKVIAAGEALRGGVPRVVIADGRHADPIRLALSGAGGTRVTLSPVSGESRTA